jgi:hypothetical protein
MIKLLTLWAAWRLLRALVAMVVIATLALLLLGGASRRGGDGESVVGRLQHQARPLEQQLQHTLQKAFQP